ncbi:MAG: DUF4352 domain-containing protein [Oryzihumus sp.]
MPARPPVVDRTPVVHPGHHRRNRLVAVVGTLVLAGVVSAAASGGGSQASVRGQQAAAAEHRSTVRDGRLEFDVTGLTCGLSSVGTATFGQRPRGQYCRVSLTVENVADQPQSLFADNQLLVDASGHKFSADSTASIYDGGDKVQTIYQEVAPGESVSGDVYYDVPRSARPAAVELHDSAYSDGVTLSLR